jgi:tetraacyldisaccharide 4'-kinase
MARWLQRQGWRVAVLSRGYGGRRVGETRVVSDGEGPVCAWSDVGDEPYLLAQELPGVPVLVGARRVLSGRVACEQFGAQVVVLDDGFQHRALQREIDVVLIDAMRPFGHGALVPRGNLREPVSALRRASVLVLTRTELAGETLPELIVQLRRWHGQRPIYRMHTVMQTLWHVGEQRCEEATVLQHRRVVAFAGIGNPQAFAATLRQGGCEVAALLVFPDHYRYTITDWQAIVEMAQRYGGECVVTTTKDAVRLQQSWQASIPLYTVRTEVTFAHDEQPLTAQLQALLDATDSGT